MPCNDGGPLYPSAALSAENTRLKDRNNKLAYDNDLLRETLLKIMNAAPGTPVEIDASVMKMFEKDQIAHRKEDLKRLENTFRTALANDIARDELKLSRDLCFKYLGQVVMASPKKPLADQLGFDPNAY